MRLRYTRYRTRRISENSSIFCVRNHETINDYGSDLYRVNEFSRILELNDKKMKKKIYFYFKSRKFKQLTERCHSRPIRGGTY